MLLHARITTGVWNQKKKKSGAHRDLSYICAPGKMEGVRKLMSMKFRKAIAAVLSAAMVVTAVPAVSMTTEAAAPQEHIDLSRQVAGEGMVLMENNGALPLAEGEKVAMFGRAMIDYVRGGGGSGQTNVDYTYNILQGMQMKEEEGKVELYKPLVDFYTEQVTVNGITDDANISISNELLNAAAGDASTAIVTIGRYSSEGSDRSATKGDYYLSDAETELITRVAAAFDRTVVVLNVGAVLDTEWINTIDGIDSVLMAWQAGMEGGLATADVLVGDVNPSGKFVDTFAKSYEDYPSSDTFYESSSYVNYTEDIFVGYRYFETFDPNYERVNYEFGYGLSYTTFETTDVQVSVDGDDIVTSAKVTNTGDVAGKQVVQVYFSAPQGKLGKPAKELAAFDKTDLLEPGESQELTMRFPISDMSSYDDTGKVQKSAYVLEAGDYNVYVGNSIKDAGEKGVRFTYTISEDTITEQLSEQCAPTQLNERLLADGTYEELETPEEMNPHYTIAAEGTTRVESENFINSSGDLNIETYYDDNLQQQKCLAYLNARNKYMEYELTAEQAGRYAIVMCMANGNAALSNCFNVFVNGEQQPGIVFNVEQTGDGSGASEWYNFVECEPFYINLVEGENLVRFVANGNNPNYDYMLVTRVGDVEDYYRSVIKASGQNKIEGEDFDISGGTNSNAVRIENFTKDGEAASCLAYMNYAGNYVSYYLKVEEAGDYDVILNAANGRASFDFDPGIEVNGTAVPATVTAVQTGDGDGASEWYNFEDLAPVTVTLPEGNCILTLKASETNKYPNIDYILVEKKDEQEIQARASRAASDDKLMLLDVYNNPDLMDAFIAQISDEQLIDMLGGQPNTGVANTGGMGNLMEFGIPNAMTADGPQGIRIGTTCTAWPVSTLLACTWDVDLVEKVGKAAAIEAHNNGIDIWLAPGMNIHRDPLCGRNFEYYSEDPLITGKMAAAITKGCQSEGVSITLKHFTVNNKETNRNSSDSRMSERALREIYLKGFEIAVKEADPWSIMTSYNFLNGVETSENKELLTNIARGEWGYEGIFMTDWGNNSNHARELLAGNDVKMPSGSPSVLASALERGLITRADMEASVKRLLNLIMKVNVFHDKIVEPPTTEIGADTYFKAADNILWSQTARAEATSDSDGGNNLGYCDAGAWTQYQIKVEKSGQYDLSARIASNAGAGAFDVVVDGEVIASFEAVNTGAWQNWTTLDAQNVYLEEGVHTLRLEFTESGSNVNWLRFTLTKEDGDVTEYLEQLIQYYGNYQHAADTDIERVLSELKAVDERKYEEWSQIMDYWAYVNDEMVVNTKVAPDGLVDDDSMCIVVLGFALNDDGSMKEELIGRLTVALETAKKYPNAYVACTGGGTAKDNPDATEADQMAAWLIEQGLDESRLIVENKSKSTVQNAQFTYAILRADYPQIKSLCMVTSDYHVQRGCLLYYSQCLLSAYEAGDQILEIISNAGYEAGHAGYESIQLQANGVAQVAGIQVSSEVPELSKLTAIQVSGKKDYMTGEELDLTVKASYDTGYERDVTDKVTVTGYNEKRVGKQTITVAYEENGSQASADYTINVKSGAAVETLEALYQTWAQLDLAEYTEESADALRAALAQAKAVLENESATQEEVTNATTALVNAFGGLEYGVQKVHLKTAIEFSEKLMELANNYEDVEALKAAVEAGKAVLEDTGATQEEADQAVYDILGELEKLAKKADVISLESLIEAAEELDSDRYTSESVRALQEAIENGKAVLADPDRTDSAISDAYTQIVSAVFGLEMRGNKAALEAMIDKAEKVLEEKDRYVEASLEGLEEALAAAVAVYNDADALQSEINAAVKDLTLEVADARLLGDVDGDGKITTSDTAAVLRVSAEFTEFSEEEAASADVNGDGVVNTTDAAFILQYTAERIAAF